MKTLLAAAQQRLAWGSGLLAAFGMLMCAPHLRAQSWQELRGLKPGAPIRVVADGASYRGKFRGVTEEAISLETSAGEMAVERPRVRRVLARSQSRRVRNAVIGAAIGIGVGVTVDQTLGARLRNESNGSGRAATYALPVALFSGIGAALSGNRTIYRAR